MNELFRSFILLSVGLLRDSGTLAEVRVPLAFRGTVSKARKLLSVPFALNSLRVTDCSQVVTQWLGPDRVVLIVIAVLRFNTSEIRGMVWIAGPLVLRCRRVRTQEPRKASGMHPRSARSRRKAIRQGLAQTPKALSKPILPCCTVRMFSGEPLACNAATSAWVHLIA